MKNIISIFKKYKILFFVFLFLLNFNILTFADDYGNESYILPPVQSIDLKYENIKKSIIGYGWGYAEFRSKIDNKILVCGIPKDYFLQNIDNAYSLYGTPWYSMEGALYDTSFNYIARKSENLLYLSQWELIELKYIDETNVPDNCIKPNFNEPPIASLGKESISNFEFDDYSAYFYTPSNNSIVNFHYKDKYFWKFNARLYVKFDGDMYITDKKIMEMLISNLELSSPFEIYDPVGTYVQRPSLLNGFKAKAYIDFKVGFPSDFEFKEYYLTASFPGSGTSNSPEIKPATIKIKLSNDGSIQEGVIGSDGVIEGVQGGNVTNDSLSDFPLAPDSEAGIGEWFKYIGELVIWLITYPFKLLSDVFNVLGNYINSMMRELEETARAMNGLLTFIPQDILNVAYGFIAFTLLYSVVRGVLKLIRG